MALEDLAMFQSLPGCTVFYPSDAVAMERAVELAASTRGITFLRAGRPQVSLWLSWIVCTINLILNTAGAGGLRQ